MGDHQRIPTVVCFASFWGEGKVAFGGPRGELPSERAFTLRLPG